MAQYADACKDLDDGDPTCPAGTEIEQFLETALSNEPFPI